MKQILVLFAYFTLKPDVCIYVQKVIRYCIFGIKHSMPSIFTTGPDMVFLATPLSVCALLLPVIIIVSFLLPGTAAADYKALVFKGCAAQKFQDPTEIYSQNLKSLLEALVSQSSQKNFFATTSGDGVTAITGLYQCRGDLSNSTCSNCVSKAANKVHLLCRKATAARVQYNGCYLTYEVVGFVQASDTKLLYRVCGSTQVSGVGFTERRDAAFETVVNGVKNSNALFYAGNYQSVLVLGQCEGDLSGAGCGDCVGSAVESVGTDCGNSISGQVYLNKCYISYTYYPNGVPNISSTPGAGKEQHKDRTVAIAIGGIAALGFGVASLMFVRSVFRKRPAAVKPESWH